MHREPPELKKNLPDSPPRDKAHIEHDRTLLLLRNVAVCIAALLFICTFLPESIFAHSGNHLLGAIAYLFGAVAYIMELLMLNNVFRTRVSFNEMFMPYVFGLLYIMMAIHYFQKE